MTGAKPAFGEAALIWLRPFEVVLIEIVPAGEAPALSRTWRTAALPAGFAEPTRAIAPGDAASSHVTTGVLPPAAKGGNLVAVAPGFLAGKLDARLDGEPVASVQVWSEHAFWKATWQAWRIPVGPSFGSRKVEFGFQSKDGKVVDVTWRTVFIPGGE